MDTMGIKYNIMRYDMIGCRWRFPKMLVPRLRMGFNTKMVIHFLDDFGIFGVPPILGHLQLIHLDVIYDG